MIDLYGATSELVAVLVAGGVAAAMDVRDLDLPGVLVPPPDLAYRFSKGCADATWRIVAATGNVGREQALAQLGPLLAQVTAALGHVVVGGRPVDLQVADGGGPMPAYELTFTTRIMDTPPRKDLHP